MVKITAEQRRVDPANPEPGFYLISLVPGGWRVPARIITENDYIRAIVNGSEIPEYWRRDDLPDQWADAIADGRLFEHQLFRILLFGERCDSVAYQHGLATKAWASAHQPDHPCLTPLKPIDKNKLPATDF